MEAEDCVSEDRVSTWVEIKSVKKPNMELPSRGTAPAPTQWVYQVGQMLDSLWAASRGLSEPSARLPCVPQVRTCVTGPSPETCLHTVTAATSWIKHWGEPLAARAPSPRFQFHFMSFPEQGRYGTSKRTTQRKAPRALTLLVGFKTS